MFLAENLVNIGKYEVTERILLAKVLEEQDLVISGIVDTKTAPEIENYDLQSGIKCRCPLERKPSVHFDKLKVILNELTKALAACERCEF